MKGSVIALATLAMLLVFCGSFFAIAAPGDGQTGMVTYPCWFFGFLFAIASFGKGGLKKGNRELVLTFGLLAIISVALAFLAAFNYESNWKLDPKSGEPVFDHNETTNIK